MLERGLCSVVLFIVAASAFQLSNGYERTSIFLRSTTHNTCSDFPSEDFDPYGDLLNFQKPLLDEVAVNSLTLREIETTEVNPGKIVEDEAVRKRRERYRWEFWDDFMEQELGDINAELLEGERWIQEMRDLVEMKRGK